MRLVYAVVLAVPAPIAERLADLLIHAKGSTLGVDESRFEQ